MSDPSVPDMLDLAQRLARDAAGATRSHVGPIIAGRKPDDSVVTEVDHVVQARILRGISQAFPDHAVCAEEAPRGPSVHGPSSRTRFCWVVDPLDGTRNYASAFPCFSTSIAVLDKGRPVVGVVFEHNLGWMYAATASQSATLNGSAIEVKEGIGQPDMLVGIPSSKDQMTVAVLRRWVAERGLICRNVGSAAFHLGMVASGALAAAFCKRAKIWDLAAGWLLVVEAGGRVTDQAGADLVPFDLDADPNADLPFLAAAPNTHDYLLRSIRSALA